MTTGTQAPGTPPGSPYAPSPHGMYLQHFHLHTAPFGITPDPAFFYTGNTRGALLDALLYAVTQGEGIVKLTGEVGSGKTMLCRMLAERLPPRVDVLYLLNPCLEPDEVLHAIAAELGLELDGRRADEVLRALHAELISRHAAGRQVVLLAEEAQAMPEATLEAVRLLTNLETASHKLLQIVLFGQPELDRTLDLPQLRQLKERITHSFIVPRLPPALLNDYLACRLAAAGRAAPLAFAPAALRRLAHASQGIVRRINILADKALLAAYAADAQQVQGSHMRAAIADSPFRPAPWHAGKLLARALCALMLLLAATLLWQWLAPAAASGAGATAGSGAPSGTSGTSGTSSISGTSGIRGTGGTDGTSRAALRAPPPAAGASTDSGGTGPAPSAATAQAASAPAGESSAARRQPPPAAPLLDSSLAASRAWLAAQAPRRLALHVASLPASDTAAAEAFLQQAQQATGLRDLHVFRLPGALPAAAPASAAAKAAAGGRATAMPNAGAPTGKAAPGDAPRLDFVYGSYADRASAEAVWTRLAGSSPRNILLVDIDKFRMEINDAAPAKP